MKSLILILFMLVTLAACTGGGGGGGSSSGSDRDTVTTKDPVVSEELILELETLWNALSVYESSEWKSQENSMEMRFKRSMKFGKVVENEFPQFSHAEGRIVLKFFNDYSESGESPDFRKIATQLLKEEQYEK